MMTTEIYSKNGRIYVERQFEAGNSWIISARFAAKSVAEACAKFPLYLHEATSVLGTLPEPAEMIEGIRLAEEWELYYELSPTMKAQFQAESERQFCLESGLLGALGDDTAPKLSKVTLDALTVLAASDEDPRAKKANEYLSGMAARGFVPDLGKWPFETTAHTCIDRPSQPCANVLCPHVPTT